MKFFAPRKYLEYAGRKGRLALKKAQVIGKDVRIDPSCDLAISSMLELHTGQIEIGARNLLEVGVVVRAYSGKITTGADVTIGPYSVLYCNADLIIGDGVRIGPHVTIVAGNHTFEDRTEFIFRQGMRSIGIQISDDVWIGAGAKVLDGVHVGHGAVIAAGAVVTKSIEAWAVVAGAPARVIRMRGEATAADQSSTR